jgi:hypothetical protein
MVSIHHQPELNPWPPHPQGSALTPLLSTKYQAISPQTHMYMRVFKMLIYYINSLWHLKTGVENQNFELNFFKVDAKIAHVLVIKISDFFEFFWNLCGISKVALVKCEWLIFKLHFGLDNDLCWIWASLTK